MEPTIWVAIISLIGSVIVALITKIGITNELKVKDAVFEEHLKTVDKKLTEHNQYAEKFASITTDIKLIQQDINYLKTK